MTNYLGGESVAGGKLKSTGTTLWLSPNAKATNESSFSVLPGGYRELGGDFTNIRYSVFFWSGAKYNNRAPWVRLLNFNNGNVNRFKYYEPGGASVRCLRD